MGTRYSFLGKTQLSNGSPTHSQHTSHLRDTGKFISQSCFLQASLSHLALENYFSHPNSHTCREGIRRRDQGYTKSFFLLFNSDVAFLLSPVSILYSKARKCHLLFCITSLETIPGYPAITPTASYSSKDRIRLLQNLGAFSFKIYALSKMFKNAALKENITKTISISLYFRVLCKFSKLLFRALRSLFSSAVLFVYGLWVYSHLYRVSKEISLHTML